PTFAVEMPTDGGKNFSPPADAPAYFANEAVPESARVANSATFTDEDVAATDEDVAAVPDVGQDSAVAAEPERRDMRAYAHKSSRHASGRSKGHGGSTRYPKSASSAR